MWTACYTRSFLDIGCGEGWALKYFKESDWEVLGLDFSDYGCKSQNPEHIDFLKKGNIYDNIEILMRNPHQFDCILLDSVLEHVLEAIIVTAKL